MNIANTWQRCDQASLNMQCSDVVVCIFMLLCSLFKCSIECFTVIFCHKTLGLNMPKIIAQKKSNLSSASGKVFGIIGIMT